VRGEKHALTHYPPIKLNASFSDSMRALRMSSATTSSPSLCHKILHSSRLTSVAACQGRLSLPLASFTRNSPPSKPSSYLFKSEYRSKFVAFWTLIYFQVFAADGNINSIGGNYLFLSWLPQRILFYSNYLCGFHSAYSSTQTASVASTAHIVLLKLPLWLPQRILCYSNCLCGFHSAYCFTHTASVETTARIVLLKLPLWFPQSHYEYSKWLIII